MVKSGEQAKLIGEYRGKIIAGHRVALPAQFRKQIGKEFIITKGYEGCLLIVPAASWNTLVEPMQSRSFLDRNVRDSLRFLVGSAFDMDADGQGRIVVPEALRLYSQIQFVEKKDAEVVFVGLVNWIEVWERSKWQARTAYLDDNADTIAQELLTIQDKNK
jgi:MraZ protein